MREQDTLKIRLLGSVAATALALTGVTAATAQDNTGSDGSEPEDRLVVTGIRAAIESSLDAKRENTSIVEAITAEDIGKLPDLSIADSLARLPGVTAQRVRGRAQQISIRGLGPDFSLALLNGREVVSAGNNRGIEFDQFPSELIAQGLVYKTPDAQLAATGIAGAVDLRTIRPLDFDDMQINVSGRYVFNDQDQLNPDFDEDGYRLFASIIDQNDAGTLGWSLGVTVQSNPTQFTSRELKTDEGQVATDAGTGLLYPQDNPRTGVVSRDFERTSVTGALQFEPNEQFQATLDVFYSETEDAGIFRGVETPLATWAGVSGPSAISGDGPFGSSITYDNVAPILRTDTEGNESELFAIGLNTSFQLTDRLSVTADISRSELDRNDIDYESYAGTGGAIAQFNTDGDGNPIDQPRDASLLDTLTFSLNPDGDYVIDPGFDYTDPNTVFLTSPGGWGGTQVGFLKRPIIEDELNQLRLEAEYELDTPFISSVVAGVIYSEREKSFDSNEDVLRSDASWNIAVPDDPATLDSNEEVLGSRFLTIPTAAILGSTNDGGTGFPIIAYDPGALLTDGTYTLDDANDTEWVVSEEILTFFAMANIDGDLGGIPVRGNVGFQYVDTEQSSTGTLAGGGDQTLGDSYSDFLPSVNLTFEVAEDTFIRASAAKTLTRARLDQLAANQNIDINTTVCADTNADQVADVLGAADPAAGRTCYSLSGGNPFLEPYRSTSFDLAFEKYFGSTSAVSVAVFHKELSDWVADLGVIVDGSQQITAIGGTDLLLSNPEISVTRLNAPVNFADGTITGIEATATFNLDSLLPPELAGFGFFASYTYAENELEGGTNAFGQEFEPQSSPIPGYSDTVWSGNVYYENYGFRARLSARYRSDFESEIQNFDGSLSGSTALEETIWDAQLGYEWDSGPLDGFTVLFEAFNITDEPFVTVGRGTGFPSRFEEYGTTYNFAVSKRF